MDTKEQLRMIGIRTGYIRRLMGINQEELATRVGVTRAYISRIESANDVDGVPLSLYIRLADALGVTFIELVDIGINKNFKSAVNKKYRGND